MSLRDYARADWIDPDELPMRALLEYKKHFNIGNARYGSLVDSYRIHYNGALRGLRISTERMEWMVEKIALMRIRGELPPSK